MLSLQFSVYSIAEFFILPTIFHFKFSSFQREGLLYHGVSNAQKGLQW